MLPMSTKLLHKENAQNKKLIMNIESIVGLLNISKKRRETHF